MSKGEERRWGLRAGEEEAQQAPRASPRGLSAAMFLAQAQKRFGAEAPSSIHRSRSQGRVLFTPPAQQSSSACALPASCVASLDLPMGAESSC